MNIFSHEHDSALDWADGGIVAVDQRALPHDTVLMRLTTVDELIEAIGSLAIRGAPAIGIAGALGVALAAYRHGCETAAAHAAVTADAERIAAARPTAVNLRWAVSRVLGKLDEGPDAVLADALRIRSDDAQTNRQLADTAADVVLSLTDRPDGLRVLTHCNTGRFATAAVGTALGAITELARRGRVADVLVDETRPLLQGARLTTFELREAGVPHRLCVDSAAAGAMARGEVDVVLVGADRIAANGDTANKIGTYSLAVAAARHGIPFIVVAPESSWDRSIADGSVMVIEDRAADEVTAIGGVLVAPEGTPVYNPAFDVTPGELITAIVSETGVERPSRASEICELSKVLYERGWMPGTAGNISTRTDPDGKTFQVTASGKDKGSLTGRDIVEALIADGTAAGTGRPSAEASIHAAIYRTTDAGAVIHVHAPYSTAIASLHGASLSLADYELIKGLGPIADATLPIFQNWADVPRIADDVAEYLSARGANPVPALLIGHHGVTVWGADLAQARNRLECIEAIAQLMLLTKTM